MNFKNVEKNERGQRQGAYGAGEKQVNNEGVERSENTNASIPKENASSNKVNGFKISLKNVAFDVTEKEITEKFSEFGKVIRANTYKNFDVFDLNNFKSDTFFKFKGSIDWKRICHF